MASMRDLPPRRLGEADGLGSDVALRVERAASPSPSSLAAEPNITTNCAMLRPNLRTPLAVRVANGRQDGSAGKVAFEDSGAESPSNTPLQSSATRKSLALSWKVPEVPKRPRAFTRPLSDDEDDDSRDQAGPSQPVPLSQTWRTPMKRKEPPSVEEATTLLDLQQQHFDVDDDIPSSPQPEAEKELSQLPPPAWIRHRATSGLDALDARLACQTEGALDDTGQLPSTDVSKSGLVRGGLMEISGTPGSGKTSMAIQLAVRERIASLLHERAAIEEAVEARSETSDAASDGGEASSSSITEWDRCKETAAHVVLVDTEGSMTAQRIAGIVVEEAKVARRCEPLPVSLQLFIEGVLEGLHICRCITMHEFFATLEMLAPMQCGSSELKKPSNAPQASILPSATTTPASTQNPRAQEAASNLDALRLSKMLPSHISLVIIDSVSHYFRAPVVGQQHETPARRERALRLAFVRAFVARARKAQPGLRIVATNQMALTFINPASGERSRLTDERGRGCLQPSLAMRAWVPEDVAEQHAWQVLLFREGKPSGRRFAQIVGRPSALRPRQSFAPTHAASVLQSTDERYWRTWLPFHVDRETSLLRGPRDGEDESSSANENIAAAEAM